MDTITKSPGHGTRRKGPQATNCRLPATSRWLEARSQELKNDVGNVLSDLLFGRTDAERGNAAGWHGAFWRPRAYTARARAACDASSPCRGRLPPNWWRHA